MASARTIPPSHVGTHSFQHDAGQPDPMEFPQLNNEEEGDDWEMVPKETPAVPPTVKFQLTKSQDMRQAEKTSITATHKQYKENPKKLLHSQSSPNLRDYTIEESDSDDSESFEHVEQTQDDASSNFSLVSNPPSVNSIWSSRISFKDALLKKDEPSASSTIPEDSEAQLPPKKHHGQRIKKIKPKFIVQQVAPMKHAKSTGDLSKFLLDEDEEILGDSDAHEYYSRKAQGSLGRRNGKKQRPDEAKRLQMTMAKKNSQRARQGK